MSDLNFHSPRVRIDWDLLDKIEAAHRSVDMSEPDLIACLQTIYDNSDGNYDAWTEDIAKEAIDRIATLEARAEYLNTLNLNQLSTITELRERIATLEAQELGFVATLSCMEAEAERLRNRIAEMESQVAKIQQLLTATWPETTTTAMTSQTHGELSRARSKGTWFRD